MSNINYDVTYPVTYNTAYKHYLARYRVTIKPYKRTYSISYGAQIYVYYTYYYDAAVSFDDGNEISVSYTTPSATLDSSHPSITLTVPVQESGPFSRVYIRNPHPENITFNNSNTGFGIQYTTKAEFEIQFNSVGFASNQNATFRCSTLAKNCISQYEWTGATVYYKKSTDTNYTSSNATVSGGWSDVTVYTSIGLEDGYTYDVYILATADDGSTARTPVAQFTTTDADAVATCISPVGAFTNGDVLFSWAHSTAYNTPQHAYSLRYSSNNGGSWTTLVDHLVSSASTYITNINIAGSYIWQVRTYNTNDVAGEWVQAAFVNNVPAIPPTNIIVTTEGRPTVSWSAPSQSAFQIRAILGDSIEYESGAVYSSSSTYKINKYLYDGRAYEIKMRIYNALGEASEWVEVGYQQPIIPDVEFDAVQDSNGGVDIKIKENNNFEKYYILRNGIPIALIGGTSYYDRYAIGDVNYSVVAVTNGDNSDIKSAGIKAIYSKATIVTLDGETYAVNKRFNETYSVKTSSEPRYNKALFIGDSKPSHFADKMVEKSFSVTCFDEYETLEKLLGQVVFYADNYGNGGYCFVSAYSKENDYLQTSNGTYANEVTLTLEVTNYDDSIEYEL